jgi:hypothetical protein
MYRNYLNIYLISFINLIISAGCQKGELIPVPELKQQSYSIGPSSQIIEFNNIRLEIPEGSVKDCTLITFGYTDICNQVGSVFYFRCLAPSLYPKNLVFNKPVRLSVSEDLYWIVDEYGYPVNEDINEISLYEILSDSAIKIPDCGISYLQDKIKVSAEIEHFGYYQIGIDKEYYLDPGFVNVEIYSEDTISFTYTINTIKSLYGNWGVARIYPAYLNNILFLNLNAFEEKDGEAFWLYSEVDSAGTFERIQTNEEYLFSYFSDSTNFVRSLPYDTALIKITRFDNPGRIEGTYEGPGWFWTIIGSNTKVVELKAEFSLPFE